MGAGPGRGLGAPLKRDLAAARVREMIAAGTLKPGAPVPSAAALAKATGYSQLTCRAALRRLAAEGALVPGVSSGARMRVRNPAGGTAAGVLLAALSRGLAERRHRAGLTQEQLAEKAGVTVTTVGHAETGRLWHSRNFWVRADALLDGYGDLLRMFDDWRAVNAGEAPGPVPEPPAPPVVLPVSVTITPGGVLVTWPDGTQALMRPPGD